MKAIFAAALLAVFGAIAIGQLQAAEVKAGNIVIAEAWTRATPPGADVAAGYLTVTNMGDAPDRLTGATAGFANVQIHQMSMTGGVMKMGEMTGGLEIPAHATVKFATGGNHLMLTALKHPLVKGESVKVTLSFAQAGTIDVDFAVAAVGASAP